ncbi:EthD family reductase [Sphingobium limneticum]|uniref:EthD family reductase n=1 Tax=Sphingobium limneticum TaxID=1007511 RepID=A0A5J5I5Y5_9SPHN|nr:EthD family reductase [Sphingobium limneticum]KAA9018204.1 EthD family reductase [Sphingobium limneticum]KAA9030840.1 EthD family reductase [Sphingobium limneticum]
MLRVSATYPNLPGSHFDGDDYVGRHAPFARGLLEPLGLRALRITIGTAALDGAPPPYWALSELIFDDRDSFDRAMDICGAALMGDAPRYTNVDPVLQISSLIDA